MQNVIASTGSGEGRGAGKAKLAKGRDYESVLKTWVKDSGTAKSEAEVREWGEKAVADIGSAANNATLGWVKVGKTVKRHVGLIQPEGPQTRPDPYDILAAHPDVPYGASHLRNFVAAYDLWVEFGGEGKAPKLGIGYFTLVLNSRLVTSEKERFLKLTLDNGWTTRQLKAEVEKFLGKDGVGDDKAKSNPAPIAWDDLDVPLATLNAIIIGLRSHRPSGTIPEATAESLRAILPELNGILNAYEAQEGGAA
jgi:hypothetical protein